MQDAWRKEAGAPLPLSKGIWENAEETKMVPAVLRTAKRERQERSRLLCSEGAPQENVCGTFQGRLMLFAKSFRRLIRMILCVREIQAVELQPFMFPA